MANANYQNIAKSTNPRTIKGGYKNTILFCPVADFLAISKPPDVAAEIGDLVKVAGAHTFTDPKGFFSIACKTKSVNLKGSTIGDEGSGLMQWVGEFVILGDSASTQEMLERQLNDQCIFLLKESACLEDDSYVQCGDECEQPTIKVEFDSSNTDGTKNYKLTFTTTTKYFYAFEVTMSTE
jgi:hypothetical protein